MLVEFIQKSQSDFICRIKIKGIYSIYWGNFVVYLSLNLSFSPYKIIWHGEGWGRCHIDMLHTYECSSQQLWLLGIVDGRALVTFGSFELKSRILNLNNVKYQIFYFSEHHLLNQILQACTQYPKKQIQKLLSLLNMSEKITFFWRDETRVAATQVLWLKDKNYVHYMFITNKIQNL